tara:strand:- start:165 stop:602 length:438 start_codon:yes stop_codon:yes gene_type:complete
MQTIQFEAVKISMTQSSDGIVLKLGIHPDDLSDKLFTDYVGSRYMVAMAKIMDDEQPEPTRDDIKRVKDSCCALCREPKFQAWLLRDQGVDVNENNAVSFLREQLGISSRSELDTNSIARAAFIDIREEFQLWLKTSVTSKLWQE